MTTSSRGADESGSTLALVPAAVLILLLLLSLTLDAAATFAAQRRLADACAASANDAATAGLRPADLYGTTGRSAQVVDAQRATDIARARSAPLAEAWGAPVRVHVTIDGATVTVSLEGEPPLPVGVAGRPSRARVTASCQATSIRR